MRTDHRRTNHVIDGQTVRRVRTNPNRASSLRPRKQEAQCLRQHRSSPGQSLCLQGRLRGWTMGSNDERLLRGCAPPLRSSTAAATCEHHSGDPTHSFRTTTYGTLVSSSGLWHGGGPRLVPSLQWEVGGPAALGCRALLLQQRGSIMTSDHDMLWRRCAYLGRVLLPLLDQEPWRQDRRKERLHSWAIDVAVGERLMEVFVALAAHAVAVDTSVSATDFETLPLSAVADAATGKRDFELLAGLPDSFADDREEMAVKIFRLYAYKGGQTSLQLLRLSTEVRHTLTVLAAREPVPSPTCGDVFRQADQANLPQ